METCEVLIVGGGPAGSTCARRLRQSGVDVLLMDARTFPREKPCAGWLTPAVLATLQIEPDDYRRTGVLQEIRGFRTSLMGGEELVTSYGGTVSHMIRRGEFDDYLLRRCGARLVLGEPVASLVRQEGGWLVNGRYRARLLVGAGGHTCPVARLLGATVGAERAIIAQSVEFPLPRDRGGECAVRGEVPELLFSRDLQGYGWIIRKGAFLNVGFGRMDLTGFAREMAGFRSVLAARGIAAPDAAVRFQGHAYRTWQGRGGRRRLDDGVLLIGDSAGLAAPFSGEGILPAVESALLAGRTILAADGDYRRDNLEPYLAELNGRFGGGCPALPFPVPPAMIARLAPLLLASPLLVRHLLLDRWFLHTGRKGIPAE